MKDAEKSTWMLKALYRQQLFVEAICQLQQLLSKPRSMDAI